MTMKQLIDKNKSDEVETVGEGSGENESELKTINTIETDYIMIPVDILEKYRAKKPKKVKEF